MSERTNSEESDDIIFVCEHKSEHNELKTEGIERQLPKREQSYKAQEKREPSMSFNEQEVIELNKLLKKQEQSLKLMEKENARQEKELKKHERMIREEKRLKEAEERKALREQNKIQSKEERLRRLEEKKLAEEEAVKKRKEKAMKGMKYLLTVSQKYSDFYKDKITEVKSNSKNIGREKNKLLPTVDDMKEAAVSKSTKSDVKKSVDITKELKYFEGGELHPYQVEGVAWLTVLYDNGLNGILADEMGLGKTVQVIALICHLLEKGVRGPYLILAPLSTLSNWESEFVRFAPKVPVVIFHGNKEERQILGRQIYKKYPIGNVMTGPVIVTSYEMPRLAESTFKNLNFQYVIVDEGHRIKNPESQLGKFLRTLNTGNRLLLTGTPLQNNITELWSLLNFLMPQLFNNMDTFASLLMLEDVQDENRLLEQEEKSNIISTLHKVLAPFMLRRLKSDVLKHMVPKKEVFVYCPLSELQRELYAYVLDKNISALLQKEKKDEDVIDLEAPRKKRKCTQKIQKIIYVDDEDSDDFSDYEERLSAQECAEYNISKKHEKFVVRVTMKNTMMMFKKIVNHPYLVHFPLDPSSEEKQLLINEDLITSSGKIMVLDIMLPKLKEKGHKILIFSTLVMALDFVEELMIMRGHKYCRLDGNHNLEDRKQSIDDFNGDPDILVFLISTRAGGLGLNLMGADTVIFLDRDWNPQMDIQAQDRCHRIGQTKPVMVYTLISKNTIDEVILTRGHQKRLLEKLVIKDGKFRSIKRDDGIESELMELRKLLDKENQKFGEMFSDEKLEKLLDRSDLYKMMENS